MVLREYKGVTYENNKWHLRGVTHAHVSELITFSRYDTRYEVILTDDDFIPLMELKNESKSYMNPQGYVDPPSKYYIDRLWDELDKSHSARAKLHDELIIAEGQRVQWKMKYEAEFLEKTKFRAYNESLVPLIEAAQELENSYHDSYVVNRVRQASKNIRDTWEATKARCS